MKINIQPSAFSGLFCLMCFITVSFNGYGQKDTATFHRNAIFFEMGGAGGSHAMNYERKFNLKPHLDYGLRIGFGFDNYLDYNGKFNPNIVIPAMVALMHGKNHKVELGVGQTYSNIIESSTNTGEAIRRSNFSTTFNIGYRYQHPLKGILIRCGYTPYIEFNETFKHWAGLSIGYSF